MPSHEIRMKPTRVLPVVTAPDAEPRAFTDAAEAVAYLDVLYRQSTDFLAESFRKVVREGRPGARYRAV